MPFRTAKTQIWQYDIQIKGRRLRGSCGTTDYEEAKAVEAEVRRQAKQSVKETSDYTLSEALGTYIAEICDGQPSASTSRSQAKAILGAISGKTKLSDLTQADLMHMVVKMRANCANATVNRRLQFMGRAIRHLGKVHKATLPDIEYKALEVKEPKERIRELTWDEQQRLFEHLPEDLREAVMFCLMTGCRISTMTRLLWKDVGDTEMRFWLKGDDYMTFPISRELRALLSALPRSNVVRDSRYVFTRLDKQTLERTQIVAKGGVFNAEFRAAVQAAEIEDFRFHDLRHTFATRMLRQTNNLKLVSRLLGHKDIASTMKYAHVQVEDMRAALDGFSPLSGGVPQSFPQSVKKNR